MRGLAAPRSGPKNGVLSVSPPTVNDYSARALKMARTTLKTLVPTRFMLTMGHLVSTLMLTYSKRENILAGLPNDPDQSRYDEAKHEVRNLAC